jgi:hypothetical protein
MSVAHLLSSEKQENYIFPNFYISSFLGYWIRETPEPRLLASTFLPSSSPSSATPSTPNPPSSSSVDYGTEEYKITDLFTTTTAATTVTTKTTTEKPKIVESDKQS